MPTGAGGQASNQLRLMKWDHVEQASRDWIEEAMQFEYLEENNKGNVWTPGGIHLRVWPYDNLRTIILWVLVIGNKDVRVFGTQREAIDACTLRDLKPDMGKGSPITNLETAIDNETGTVLYAVLSDFNGKDHKMLLSYHDMMKFLGPSDNCIQKAARDVENTTLRPGDTANDSHPSHPILPRPNLKHFTDR